MSKFYSEYYLTCELPENFIFSWFEPAETWAFYFGHLE